MENSIFQRREIKFLVDARQRAILERAFRGRMAPDPHGESTICSIYYDTPDCRLARASLEKPIYKEKLRMRSYGRASPEGTVFLELKKKYKGVVFKRRIELPEEEASACMAGESLLPADRQIGREIDYFRRFYEGIRPADYLCYDRSPWYSVEDPPSARHLRQAHPFPAGGHASHGGARRSAAPPAAAVPLRGQDRRRHPALAAGGPGARRGPAGQLLQIRRGLSPYHQKMLI